MIWFDRAGHDNDSRRGYLEDRAFLLLAADLLRDPDAEADRLLDAPEDRPTKAPAAGFRSPQASQDRALGSFM